MYGQMCVLVAVAILEEIVWHLQISNICFSQKRIVAHGLLVILVTYVLASWILCFVSCIMKTCLFKITPLNSLLYRITGVYIIFLFLHKHIDCGYSLEPPWQGGSIKYPQSIF